MQFMRPKENFSMVRVTPYKKKLFLKNFMPMLFHLDPEIVLEQNWMR
jgi:hypothetical protein